MSGRLDLCPQCEEDMRAITPGVETCTGCGYTRRVRFNHGWQDSGACVGRWDIFHLGRGKDSRPARKICDGCSVRMWCLEYAIDAAEPFGVWGGLSVQERRRLKLDPLAMWKKCQECRLWFVTSKKKAPARTHCSNRCHQDTRRKQRGETTGNKGFTGCSDG